MTLDAIVRAYRDVQLATLAEDPPRGDKWAFELKFDGYRIVACKSGATVRLLSRRQQDWTAQFEAVAQAIEKVRAKELVLDGEVCALDERGLPSFQRLQNRATKTSRLVYFVFDVLMEDGEDVRALPWSKRRARLESLFERKKISSDRIILSESLHADPAKILQMACDAGLEGIVAKHVDAPYAAARTKTWLKIKCHVREELPIIGWLPYEPDPRAVGALLLGKKGDDGALRFAGKVGTGYDERTRRELAELLAEDHASHATAKGVPRYGGLVRFVEPHHAAEIAFTEWTNGGHVRHPSFVALKRNRASPGSIAGVRITNPERVLDPTGLTKLDLARYYEAIADVMLPHVRGRPLTLVRWAEGKTTEKGGMYLRHARAWGPAALRRVRIREKTKIGEYLVADTREALVSLAQMDILEIHTWNATVDDIERPDRLVFDLDPAPDVPWKRVVRAARHVRDRLSGLGMSSWVKTTGGKGLHVVAPVERSAGWSEWLDFTRELANVLVHDAPKSM